jgi:hypothetical protein
MGIVPAHLTDPIFVAGALCDPAKAKTGSIRKKRNMIAHNRFKRSHVTAVLGGLLVLGFANFTHLATDANASPPWRSLFGHNRCDTCGDGAVASELGGSWFWMRSPEQEKVVVAGLFNRYCIRCHGVDGRGIWDIPGVPDFTNTRWQASRSDEQIARIVVEGRGAVMPPFRGTLTLEEAWAMARYLRTFVPGTEISRPDLSAPDKTQKPDKAGKK